MLLFLWCKYSLHNIRAKWTAAMTMWTTNTICHANSMENCVLFLENMCKFQCRVDVFFLSTLFVYHLIVILHLIVEFESLQRKECVDSTFERRNKKSNQKNYSFISTKKKTNEMQRYKSANFLISCCFSLRNKNILVTHLDRKRNNSNAFVNLQVCGYVLPLYSFMLILDLTKYHLNLLS